MATSSEMKNASSPAEFQKIVSRRRAARMARIDAMAPELRACVHDYGLNVVNALLELRVSKPAHIRHIVETVLDEFSPTRGSKSRQGIQRPLGLNERPASKE